MLHDNKWLLVEVATGLQKLSCLSLDRTPAAEVLSGTAQAWLEAITDGRAWDRNRDTERVAAAFRTLARTSRRWPSPADFLDALPDVPAPLAIAYERKPASEAAKRACEQAVRSLLGTAIEQAPAARVERETTPEQRAQIEAELRRHYAGRAA